MTDIEVLRARMREAINALAAALAALKDGEPEGPRRDGLIAGIEHALNNAKPLDAYTTRLREDMDRVTRERDEAQERETCAKLEHAAAEAAVAKRDEEVARLRGVLEGICEYWNGGAESALDAIQEVERRAAEALTKEPPHAE